MRTSALRTCNNLLRRLSKGQNAVLCGRVMLFLARLLPLVDRSGLNILGNVNLQNVTPVEPAEEVRSREGERIRKQIAGLRTSRTALR